MKNIQKYFNDRKWNYILFVAVGIVIYYSNINHPLSGYIIAVFIGAVFDYMNYLPKENITSDRKKEPPNWKKNLRLILIIIAIIIVLGFIIWQAYNFYFWLNHRL